MFERLNTGGVRLTAQELRNSVYRGPYNDAIRALAREDYFTTLVTGSRNKRMDYEEIILRFLALYEDLEAYKPPLTQFLNKHMREHRDLQPNETAVRTLEECCRLAAEMFEKNAFRPPTVAGKVGTFSKALFDAIMLPLAFADRGSVSARAREIGNAISNLVTEDEEFRISLGRATADRQRVARRILTVADVLRSFDVDVSLPEFDRL